MDELTPRQTRMITTTTVNSRISMVLLDAEGVVEWANPATEAVFGWPVDELIGCPFQVLLTEPSIRVADQLTKRARQGAKVDSARLTALRRDGRQVQISVSITANEAAPGEAPGSSIVARDVTEETAAIRELARLQDRLRASFVQASFPQAFLDLSGRFEEVNEALVKLVGYSRQELIGRSALSLLDPMDPVSQGTHAAARRVLADGSARYEVVARHADGRQLALLIDVTVLTNEVGRRRGLTVFARDLSDVRAAQRRLAAQEAFYRAINRRAWDLALVSDAEGRLKYVSPSAVEFLGYAPEDLIGRPASELVHPGDRPVYEELLRGVEEHPEECSPAVLRIERATGERRWVEASSTNSLDDPDIAGVVVNLRDVTAEVDARRALERSEARYRAIVETAQEGIVALDADGNVLLANERLAELVGSPLEDIYAHGLWGLLEPEAAKFLHQRALGRAERGPERYELCYEHPDGGERVLSISASPLLSDEEGRIGSLAMVFDVTAERRAEDELRHLAMHDPLTGLPNRALLTDRLEMAAARQDRTAGNALAVIFLDLDHLKVVNDTGGHAVGDALLVEVSHRLQQLLRGTDTVARLGGDEFAVICEETSEEGAVAVAHRIQAMFAEPFLVLGRPLRSSASIGVAVSPPNPAEDLLRLADTAMYQAKSRSRGSFVFYDSSIADVQKLRRELTGDLREALATEQVFLHYQPVLDLVDERIRGVEALVRWNHPTRGMLPALEVVAAAQEAGLEAELDTRVIRAACSEMGRLVASGVLDGDSYVSVNISARSASSERLDDLVPAVLRETGLNPSQLMLEVTETSIMTDVEHTVRQLRALTELGVRVAVDDFGTGYSSLAYLHRLPLGILKIDRSFVSGLPDDVDSSMIVKSVISLAQALGLHTIAEGIETLDQAQLLREMGCHSGQGYLWSRAVPPAALEDVRATFGVPE